MVDKREKLIKIVEKDDKVLKTVLNYARSATFDREEALAELKKRVEDEAVLEAVLKYAEKARA